MSELLTTRPEKDAAATRLVYALRNAAAAEGRSGELNLAEIINAMAQAMSSMLAGAYDDRNREIILEMLPALIRAYFPRWDKIYSEIPTRS